MAEQTKKKAPAEQVERGIQRLPSGAYRVRWYDELGKRRTATFKSLASARAGLRKNQVEADNVKSGLARPKSTLTVKEAFDQWIEDRPPKRRKANESHFRVHILPFMGDVTLPRAALMVEKFQRHLEAKETGRKGEKNEQGRKLAKNTRDNILRTLSRFLDDQGYTVRLRLKVADTDYSWIKDKKDVGRFLAACEPPWFRTFAAIAVYTGMRKGEVAGLRRDDIDLANGVISIRRTYADEYVGPTKSKKARVVPLPPPLASILRRWLLAHPGPLVVTKDGAPVEPGEDVAERAQRAMKRSGIRPVNPELFCFHSLRHTYGSHQTMQTSLAIAGSLMGHQDPKTTKRYSHLDQDSLARNPRTHLDFTAPDGELETIPERDTFGTREVEKRRAQQ